jgi:thiol-disulfide isomerase/thioredoxin
MHRLPFTIALVALAGCQKHQPQPSNEAGSTSASAEPGQVKGIDRSHKGNPAPASPFNTPDGGKIGLANFHGTPLLVNLWASWCAPCVKELPTLDRLSRMPGTGGALKVIAISQDMGPHASVVAFLKSHGVTSLAAYQDPKMALSGALGAEVLPTSILFDAKGREVWRYVGDLDWNSGEAAKLLAEAGVARTG